MLASLRAFQLGAASKELTDLGGARKLASLGGGVDLGLVSKAKDAEAAAAAAHEHAGRLSEQLVAAAKEKAELKEQLAYQARQMELVSVSSGQCDLPGTGGGEGRAGAREGGARCQPHPSPFLC